MFRPTYIPWVPKCIIFDLSLLNDPKGTPAPVPHIDNNNTSTETKNDSSSTGLLNDELKFVRGCSGIQNIPNLSPSARVLLGRVYKKGIRIGLVRNPLEAQDVVRLMGVPPRTALFVAASAAHGIIPAGHVLYKDSMRVMWIRPDAAEIVALPQGREGLVGVVEVSIEHYL
ncbi:hypothetical protein E4U24_003871 [Claviceps purpurea]|nr:hypothetical protein E4U38_001663 [Claviceps purpurea]KAG6155408.1 hypothetical protein E4U11_006069 [Claviceps purpurea]KAG6169707.1 hypothetical protein E4U51_001432 [Claviceps purpurea]KAG6178467.1 hypothetical protein E4U27_003737 [Claviceps purpurea]KAG6196522.1 hypothetical protein E4U10_000941 [Claviceps purpurea]